MSVVKKPEILTLDSASLCHSIYSELYNQFFNAQDKKDDQHPYGIEEGDDTSIRLHNTAYGFAYAIAGAIEGGAGAGEGGILLDYLKKAGGDMSGGLRANYGFEAGIGNLRVLETYSYNDGGGEIGGLRIYGELDMGSSPLFFGGQKVFSHNSDTQTTYIHSQVADFGDSSLRISGEIILGDKESGVYLTPDMMLFHGHHLYHQGNANLDSVDWAMLNAKISGDLEISGKAVFSGMVRAVNGVELGIDGRVLMTFRENETTANCNLSFSEGYGIKIDGITVLGRLGESGIMVGGIGGDLFLGSADTNKVRLVSGIMDQDGDYMLLSTHGAAYFPDSLTVRHNFGQTLFSSYREDAANEGVIVHQRLRFGSDQGPYLSAFESGIRFSGSVVYYNPEIPSMQFVSHETVFGYVQSTSLFADSSRKSETLIIDTDADFIRVNKPLEGKNHIGIDGSTTRLTDGGLYFSEGKFLLAAADGVKHYGNAYMLDDLGSEFFSSGFAGSGWAVQRNKTTGNTSATFDELTVRKRMRIYELEVQKISATNGSLWISDSFSGDRVEQIN